MMTRDVAVRMLDNSRSLTEYNAVLTVMKGENEGKYPDWYWAAVVDSGLSHRKAEQFGVASAAGN